MVVYYQVLNLKTPELPNGKRAEHLKIRRPLSMTRWLSKKKSILSKKSIFLVYSDYFLSEKKNPTFFFVDLLGSGKIKDGNSW